MDKNNFSDVNGMPLSNYLIATTHSINGSSTYYSRVQIVIWVEGCDAEADLALNGGEFSVTLNFYGVIVQN